MSITLENLAFGEVSERFKESFNKVMDNIHNQNTSAKAKREILIKIVVTPMSPDDRTMCDYSVEFKEKLPTDQKPIRSIMGIMLDTETGLIEAEEYRPRQRQMFDNQS